MYGENDTLSSLCLTQVLPDFRGLWHAEAVRAIRSLTVSKAVDTLLYANLFQMSKGQFQHESPTLTQLYRDFVRVDAHFNGLM